jgi:hypothetical protein
MVSRFQMKPTYNGSYWSNLPPADTNPWLRGNLPDPARDAGKPLLTALANLRTHNKGFRKSTDKCISQLLWAARGRTPHLYNSKPWGMTIPTWAGEQNISSVYLVSNGRLSQYINWDYNRPTHSLLELGKLDERLFQKLLKLFSSSYGFIILRKNEGFGRALWEVGYQLLNLMLQANSLDISYQTCLLDESQRLTVALTGVPDPVAILGI